MNEELFTFYLMHFNHFKCNQVMAIIAHNGLNLFDVYCRHMRRMNYLTLVATGLRETV